MKIIKNKYVLWTTGIFAVIGITQGIGGFIGGALGGFGISASWVLIFKALSKANDKRKQMAEERAQIPKEVLQKKKEEKARIKAEKKTQANAEAQAVIQRLQKAEQDRMQAKMKCPRCGSKNIQLAGKHRKGFSVGKAVGGAALTGGIGALAGFAGKQTKKSDWVCLDCGRSFTIK
ncbi:hypothetical protein [Limosilactobacillus fermentum]|uniref:hypothetical protein n=1 Tax=Limosilactobacillus fermentum TaxID=1613 RepID=UPI000FEC9C21|nr:hypothetical protein [Limosilactobacillus fermentum]QAR22399.1 hypothetical protein EQG50_08030 [Limosilactobacillus fermentum]